MKRPIRTAVFCFLAARLGLWHAVAPTTANWYTFEVAGAVRRWWWGVLRSDRSIRY